MLLCEKGKKLFSEDECETRVANDSNSLNGFYFRSIPSTAFSKWGSRGELARRIFGTCAIFTQEAAPEIIRGFLTSRLHSERSKTLLEKITLCVSRGVAAIVQQDVVTSLRLSSEKTRKYVCAIHNNRWCPAIIQKLRQRSEVHASMWLLRKLSSFGVKM